LFTSALLGAILLTAIYTNFELLGVMTALLASRTLNAADHPAGATHPVIAIIRTSDVAGNSRHNDHRRDRIAGIAPRQAW
jgi:hypothetical protein